MFSFNIHKDKYINKTLLSSALPKVPTEEWSLWVFSPHNWIPPAPAAARKHPSACAEGRERGSGQ